MKQTPLRVLCCLLVSLVIGACKKKQLEGAALCETLVDQYETEIFGNPMVQMLLGGDEENAKALKLMFKTEFCACAAPLLVGDKVDELLVKNEEALMGCANAAGESMAEAAFKGTATGPTAEFCGAKESLEATELSCFEADKDISTLGQFTKLESLSLDAVPVADAKFLAALPNLRELTLGGPEVKSIAGVAALPKLKTFSINRTAVDLAPLANMEQLTSLSVQIAKPGDVSAIATLTNLRVLELSKWSEDPLKLSALAALAKLEKLSISHSVETGLSFIGKLSALQELDIRCEKEKGDFLTTLTKLEILSIAGCSFPDWRPVSGLLALREFSASWTNFSDVGLLAKLSHLALLHLGHTEVKTVENFPQLPELSELELEALPLGKLSALATLKSLDALSLSGVENVDVSALSSMGALKTLDLSDTKVADISPLKELSKLEELDLSSTKVKDIGGLKGLANLTRLDLSKTMVAPADAKELKASLAKLGRLYGADGELVE